MVFALFIESKVRILKKSHDVCYNNSSNLLKMSRTFTVSGN